MAVAAKAMRVRRDESISRFEGDIDARREEDQGKAVVATYLAKPRPQTLSDILMTGMLPDDDRHRRKGLAPGQYTWPNEAITAHSRRAQTGWRPGDMLSRSITLNRGKEGTARIDRWNNRRREGEVFGGRSVTSPHRFGKRQEDAAIPRV